MGCNENKRKNNRRFKLYNENPFCPDCNKKMILPDDIGYIIDEIGNRKLKYIPDNLCTIEHKYTVNDPRRYKANHTNEERWSILCKKCNLMRGHKCEFNKMKLEKVKMENQIKKDYYIIKLPIIKVPKIGYALNTLRLGIIDRLPKIESEYQIITG